MKMVAFCSVVLSAVSWLFLDMEGLAGEPAHNVILKYQPSLPLQVPSQETAARDASVAAGQAPAWWVNQRFVIVDRVSAEDTDLRVAVWPAVFAFGRVGLPLLAVFLSFRQRRVQSIGV